MRDRVAVHSGGSLSPQASSTLAPASNSYRRGKYLCVVSMVFDWANERDKYYWTRPNYDSLKELIRKAEQYDIMTNQPHCEDENKAKVLERIEQRLAEIERKL